MHVLVAGCGWLGSALARRLLERGHRVTGVRSSVAGAEALASQVQGLEVLALDLAEPGAAGRIPRDVGAIFALQAARGGGADAYRRAYVQVNETLLAAARELPLQALVYSSSTGIFGQTDGSEVFEHTPPLLASPSARVLAEAEALLLQAAASGLPTRVVRLSGLYGPGRLWMVDRVRQGLMGVGPGVDTWLNACHQDDAVAVLLATLDRGRDGGLYHASDAEPMRRRALVAWVAGRLGIPPAQVPLPEAGANRRVSGLRTRAELQVDLRWPSLRAGLEPFLVG